MNIDVTDIKPRIGSIVRVDRAALSNEDVVQRCLELLETVASWSFRASH